MRLWHYKLIPYLPKSQLLGQWRELNSIYKKQDNHILINYIYEYDKEDLEIYSYIVICEMTKRGYKINTENFEKYFGEEFDMRVAQGIPFITEMKLLKPPFKDHHNNTYLTICYWNLYEKYIRGQKDFHKDIWDKIQEKYMEE